MSTPATPATPATESDLQKLWNWEKGKVLILEKDVADVIGSSETEKIESAGKAIFETYIGPLALTAMKEATDVATGQMNVGTAIKNLIAAVEKAGKTMSQAAALQVIALGQNVVPTSADPTATPVVSDDVTIAAGTPAETPGAGEAAAPASTETAAAAEPEPAAPVFDPTMPPPVVSKSEPLT